MVLLKRCPKCGGDLFLERDIYGNNLRCLQCGKALNREEVMALAARRTAAQAA
jgi:hypothetical protein